ncbi:hypothetical protein BC628DRAFT_1455370 [Trametes gibbosa]|nr:hypothetical protein BC628DRAFT_1455370 [Trametes gibbosa]
MKGYKIDKKKRDELRKKSKRGEQLTEEEREFMNASPEERKNKVLDRWRECQTLIIDEISMIDGKLFDKNTLHGNSGRVTYHLAEYSLCCLATSVNSPSARQERHGRADSCYLRVRCGVVGALRGSTRYPYTRVPTEGPKVCRYAQRHEIRTP